MYAEAFQAGVWASIGSALGKLSGTVSVVGDSYVLWALILAAMVTVNTWGCRLYLRSLDAASNSVAPTVISAASSYVLSGAIGMAAFQESASLHWSLGATLIITGLALVARPRKKLHKIHSKSVSGSGLTVERSTRKRKVLSSNPTG